MERPTPQGLTPSLMVFYPELGFFWVISIGIPQNHPMVQSQRC